MYFRFCRRVDIDGSKMSPIVIVAVGQMFWLGRMSRCRSAFGIWNDVVAAETCEAARPTNSGCCPPSWTLGRRRCWSRSESDVNIATCAVAQCQTTS